MGAEAPIVGTNRSALSPGGVSVHENIWIPLRDGRRLAARLWLPNAVARHPLPAIIEYVPYRKRDQLRTRDEPIHVWLARNGYACLRVDMHGSGDSDGLLKQEFQAREREDALEMIAWAAAQSWCDGGVAMLGKSWGGYAALHAAMCRPPALRAIIPVCAGEDRYDQSLHFTGGAMLNQQVWWADQMLLFNMRPPDPAIVGPEWERMWRARVEDAEPWIEEWLKHQRRDRFWQENSVCDNYGAIECAVFAVGGWADYISRSVPRLMTGLKSRRYGLVGPWGHHYPHDGIPGPAIGFLQECRRFLDSVMKGAEDYAKEPMLRAWIGEWHKPGPDHVTHSGRWVAEAQWPSPRIRRRTLILNANGLDDGAEPEQLLRHRSPQTVGLAAPEWLSQAAPGEAPLDQREDDGKSLVFDTRPLSDRIEILGSAVLDLDLAADQPLALLAARLNDVAPDGTSLRVALGILNLTHRDGDLDPTPLEPGRRYRVRLTLPEVGHAFARGHRIRIALSTSYWPVVWPSPVPVTLTLATGSSRLTLPERPTDAADELLRRFDPPEAGPPAAVTVLEPAGTRRVLTRDLLSGTCTLSIEGVGGIAGFARRYRLDEIGTVLSHIIRQRSEITEDKPLSARHEVEESYELSRDDWQVRLETATRFSSTATEFHVIAEARAYYFGELTHERNWRIAQPRDLV